ncbi:MAG: metallophosphoesterase family protein [Acidobacteriota bacterium]
MIGPISWILLHLLASMVIQQASTMPLKQAPLVSLPETSSDTFSFIAYGDVQSNYRDMHSRLVSRMLQENPALVLNSGDLSSDDGRHYDSVFYPPAEGLLNQIPFYPAPGNHDIAWGSPFSRYPYRVFFDRVYDHLGRQPQNSHLLQPAGQKLWYSFTYAGVLFISLDSNLFIDEGRYERTHRFRSYRGYQQEQMIWLKNVLERSSQDSGIRAKFIFFHHSPFITTQTEPLPILELGGHPGHDELLIGKAMAPSSGAREQYLLDLFRLHRVTAVFTGHEHYYERWREIIRAKGSVIHSLNWLVIGGGGVRPRGHPKYRPEEIEKVMDQEFYRDYIDRISRLDSSWTSELQHVYPHPESSEADFSHYVVVSLKSSEIQFEVKDQEGRVRDRGRFNSR